MQHLRLWEWNNLIQHQMVDKMIEHLISHQKIITTDEGKVYINGNEIESETLDGKTPEDFADSEMRSYYKKFLSNHFENLVILTGAGSSIGVGTGGNTGKTRKELWESVLSSVGESKLKEFSEKIKYDYPNEDEIGDIEEMLSKANRANDFLNFCIIQKTIDKIQEQIVKDCTIELPDNSPHEIFLSKITSRKLKYDRAKVFTLNYDTLFEQAGQKGGYSVIDGFTFSLPRIFGGQYFDYDIVIRENSRIQNEENYVNRVFHLYKPHGSLDWELNGNTVVKNDNVTNPLIIYPKESKYEASYEQPFFEMMSRFQQVLRKKNTLLICIGFSFYDKHIKAMIMEAVTINPSFRLLIVAPGINENEYINDLKETSKTQNSVIITNEKFTDFARHYPYPKSYQDEYLTLKVNKDNLGESA